MGEKLFPAIAQYPQTHSGKAEKQNEWPNNSSWEERAAPEADQYLTEPHFAEADMQHA